VVRLSTVAGSRWVVNLAGLRAHSLLKERLVVKDEEIRGSAMFQTRLSRQIV